MTTSPPPLLLTPGSPSWPSDLARATPPPEQLWARGRLELLARTPRIAIVGSRAPTPYGEAQTERFALALARAGACLVSGLARGVDQAAHACALREGAPTIAVLGCGVDRPWPRGPVPDAMAREGLLLSEHPPGQGPRPFHFPLRNRLIAALSDAVLVVEAAHASGSLITARWAAEYGVDVWAVPGRIDHPMAAGCHRLLREGARFALDPGEWLGELGLGELGLGEPGLAGSPEEDVPAGGRAAPSRLARALVGETLTAEELSTRLGRPLPEVLSELSVLELEQRVLRTPGGLYRLPVR